MKLSTQLLLAALGTATLLASASGASAENHWQRHHAWRTEVNHRLARQNHRITMERRAGEITGRRAHELRAEARGIRAQERFDASRHGSHLTRSERRRLNHEENGVSGQIGH